MFLDNHFMSHNSGGFSCYRRRWSPGHPLHGCTRPYIESPAVASMWYFYGYSSSKTLCTKYPKRIALQCSLKPCSFVNISFWLTPSFSKQTSVILVFIIFDTFVLFSFSILDILLPTYISINQVLSPFGMSCFSF